MSRRIGRRRWERVLSTLASPGASGPHDITMVVGGPAGPFLFHVPLEEPYSWADLGHDGPARGA